MTPRCSLADRAVRVRVRGLCPGQAVTLRAWLADEQGEQFQSRAFFRASQTGEVDPGCQPALGGSYSGVWPMGLFWFLQPDTPFRRLIKRDVAGSPFLVHLEVFDGIQLGSQPRERPLGCCRAERWYLSRGVQRVPVREGRVRGALFLPAGETAGHREPRGAQPRSPGTPRGQGSASPPPPAMVSLAAHRSGTLPRRD